MFQLRYILGFLGFIAFIIFIIVLIARLATQNGRQQLDLAPTARLAEAASTDADFVFTESGPIVAEEEHYQIRITVNRSGRRIEVIRGFQNNVVASADFGNNEEAFRSFLAAIDRTGYSRERSTDFDNEEGLCPKGRRYVFTSDQFGEDFRRWDTSCMNVRGSFGGSINTARELYQDQIPDYNRFISGVRRDTELSI